MCRLVSVEWLRSNGPTCVPWATQFWKELDNGPTRATMFGPDFIQVRHPLWAYIQCSGSMNSTRPTDSLPQSHQVTCVGRRRIASGYSLRRHGSTTAGGGAAPSAFDLRPVAAAPAEPWSRGQNVPPCRPRAPAVSQSPRPSCTESLSSATSMASSTSAVQQHSRGRTSRKYLAPHWYLIQYMSPFICSANGSHCSLLLLLTSCETRRLQRGLFVGL